MNKTLFISVIVAIFLLSSCTKISNDTNNKDTPTVTDKVDINETSLNPKNLDNQTNCEESCKSEGYVFGYCRYGNSESKTELDCSRDYYGINNQKNIGQTPDCNHFDVRETGYYISSCCCVPDCIPDNQILNNIDSKYCCSKTTHNVSTACSFNPNTGVSYCSVSRFCGSGNN
jgi:hypothetical protein